jgi:hypothetical protein
MYLWRLFVLKRLTQKLLPPLELVSKRCVSGIGKITMELKEKRPLPEVCTVSGNDLVIFKILFEVALTFKGPLT